MGGGLINFWIEWDLQILMLLSFTLQLILFGFARIRRRKGSDLLRILLWLAYQMADSTAIYTLGHLSLRARSTEKQFVPLWASLLLLHLGGPDTITAYAVEDNHLWLRHLQILAVQVMGAAYVLYQSVGTQSTMILPSILMFGTGLLKYGERTWALKCANVEGIRSSLDWSADGSRRLPYDGRVGTAELDSEEVLLGAHYTFNACKSHFADDLMTSETEGQSIRQGIQYNGGKYMYELIEMQLSLMYDILYTKAAVICTWYGSCIRVLSTAATLVSFLLFVLNSRHAYSRVDFIVTYILLSGALVLEITSLVRAIGSSWTCAILHARRWDRVHRAIRCLRRFVQAASRRKWLDSVGQHNLLDFCTRDSTEIRSRIAKKVGLKKWWDKLHYSITIKISEGIRYVVSSRMGKKVGLKKWWEKIHYSSTIKISDSICRDLLLEEIPRRPVGDMRNARGRWTLWNISRLQGAFYNGVNTSIEGLDFDHSILRWHIATDVYLCCRGEPAADRVERAERLAKAVKEISDYMLYLYVVQPHMLPGPVRSNRYKDYCELFVTLWQEHTAEQDIVSSRTPREELATLLRDYSDKYNASIDMEDENSDDDLLYIDAGALIGVLLSEDSGIPDVLEMIAGVWIEMLGYAARHCNEVSHTKQLSNGGELVTVMGLLVEYTYRYRIEYTARHNTGQHIVHVGSTSGGS